MSLSDEELRELLNSLSFPGCQLFSPEVAAEVDRLLAYEEVELTAEQKARFEAAARRGLAAQRKRREEESR